MVKFWNTANVSPHHTNECFKVFLCHKLWCTETWCCSLIKCDKSTSRIDGNSMNDGYQNNIGFHGTSIKHFKLALPQAYYNFPLWSNFLRHLEPKIIDFWFYLATKIWERCQVVQLLVINSSIVIRNTRW